MGAYNYIMKKQKFLFLTGVAALAAFAMGCGNNKITIEDHHTEVFGDNVYIFTPEDELSEVQDTLDSIYNRQETNQFGD